jgi:hypothetical protein
MAQFCGGEYKVLARVNRQIEEKSGKMITFSNPCIVLAGVTAPGELHEFAPLDECIYWREIWLERVTSESTGSSRARDCGSHEQEQSRTVVSGNAGV